MDDTAKDRKGATIIVADLVIWLSIIWTLFYLNTILPEWTAFPLIITGGVFTVIALVFFTLGIAELPEAKQQ